MREICRPARLSFQGSLTPTSVAVHTDLRRKGGGS